MGLLSFGFKTIPSPQTECLYCMNNYCLPLNTDGFRHLNPSVGKQIEIKLEKVCPFLLIFYTFSDINPIPQNY